VNNWQVLLKEHECFERRELRRPERRDNRTIQRIAYEMEPADERVPGLAHCAASGNEGALQVRACFEHVADIAQSVVGLARDCVEGHVEYERLQRWTQRLLDLRHVPRIVPIRGLRVAPVYRHHDMQTLRFVLP